MSQGKKETYISYCQVCGKNFIENEKVYFAPVDNNIVCKKCAMIHANRQERVYIKPD